MRRLVAFWVAFWVALGSFFWYADRNGFALCKAVRHLYGTHNPDPTRARTGKLGLAASLGTGALVLYRHLVKRSGSLTNS